MERTFLIVVVAVGVIGVLGAFVALLGGRDAFQSIGRDGLVKDSDDADPRAGAAAAAGTSASPGAGAPGGGGEREEEIRQLLEARNRRRRRRGEAELDPAAELARLRRAPAGPGAADPRRGDLHPEHPAEAPRTDLDPELLAEIRQLVLARNHRRARRGLAPLDVESEIARQIAELNG